MKVLLVDDEKDFLDTMAERMQARGLEVSTATSALDALKMVEKRPYDTIIMDLMMPDLEGMEAIKALKRKQRGLQIILQTGYVTREEVTKAHRLGAVDIVEKPADIDLLMEIIKGARDKKG